MKTKLLFISIWVCLFVVTSTSATAAVYVVEDFFDYADTTALLAVWSGNLGADLTAEPLTNIMQFDYDNTSPPYNSQAVMNISPVGDWTAFQASSLSLKILGKTTNSAEPVYLIVADGNTSHKVWLEGAVTNSDDRWQVLTVRLSDFEDHGIDLTNVVSLTIGLGDGASSGGTGTVFVNDIVLYPPRCLSEYADAADVTGDCQVNEDDLMMIIDHWLFADYEVHAAAPANSPVVYYNFNDASGYVAHDSTVNHYDAAIEPGSVSDFWDSSGYSGYCISLSDPSLEIKMPSSVFSTISNKITVSIWIYGQAGSVPDPVQAVEIFAGTAPAASSTWDRLQWNIVSASQYEGWNHYAIVKDADADLMQIFVNGVLVAQDTNASAAISGVLAGTTTLSQVLGQEATTVKIDELKIYHAALSQPEIVYLALNGSGFVEQPISPVLTHANIAGQDGRVDLKELAQLSNVWLKSQLW